MDFFFFFVMDLSLYCNCNSWRHYLSIWPFLKWWICLSSVFVFRGIICLSPDHLPVNISLLWRWLHNNKVDHRVFNDDHGFHHGDHHEEDENQHHHEKMRIILRRMRRQQSVSHGGSEWVGHPPSPFLSALRPNSHHHYRDDDDDDDGNARITRPRPRGSQVVNRKVWWVLRWSRRHLCLYTYKWFWWSRRHICLYTSCQIFGTGGRVDRRVWGSTWGPRGPKNR